MAEQPTSDKTIEAAGPFLRDIVFGAHDALLTNIGIVTGFVTAFNNNHVILIAALIDVVISAVAMGLGTYLSRTSESDYLKGQLRKSSHTDLESVMANPISAALVMWVTYMISGLIPLAPFLTELAPGIAVRYTLVLTMAMFFSVGVLKGQITKTNSWRSGLQFLLFGTLAAGIGYLVGWYGQRFIG